MTVKELMRWINPQDELPETPNETSLYQISNALCLWDGRRFMLGYYHKRISNGDSFFSHSCSGNHFFVIKYLNLEIESLLAHQIDN